MAGAGGLDDDPLVLRCYPQLVFAEETTDLNDKMGHGCLSFGSSFACSYGDGDGDGSSPKMLCFGGFNGGSVANSGQESGSTCMGSSSLSSTSSTKIKTLPKSNKRNGSGDEPGRNLDRLSRAPTGRSSKRVKSSRSNSSSGTARAKVVKKEKLGERISALQQLVSPFSKTDTASVLHEAIGYIRFLQDQVQVLCSPYLRRHLPLSSATPHDHPAENNDRKNVDYLEKNMDLRSRGLCLVPIDLTVHVANDSNGADLWSSAEMVDNMSMFSL